MKRGGEEIYVGPLGRQSTHLIKYFESVQGVPKIKDGYNPATWMLEVTTSAQEHLLGVNFVDHYKNSELYGLVETPNTNEIFPSVVHFPSYANGLEFVNALQEKQSIDQGTKRPSTWHERSLLPHNILHIFPHSVPCVSVETTLVVLEKYSVHRSQILVHNLHCPYLWDDILGPRL